MPMKRMRVVAISVAMLGSALAGCADFGEIEAVDEVSVDGEGLEGVSPSAGAPCIVAPTHESGVGTYKIILPCPPPPPPRNSAAEKTGVSSPSPCLTGADANGTARIVIPCPPPPPDEE